MKYKKRREGENKGKREKTIKNNQTRERLKYKFLEYLDLKFYLWFWKI